MANIQMPKDVETLKLLIATILEKAMPHMMLRDKEWCLRELDRLKKTGRLAGVRRNIKATGVVRKLDDLGRVVIPMELRKMIGMVPGSPMEITLDEANGWVVLERYVVSCIFCADDQDLNALMGRPICENCVEHIVKGEFDYGPDTL